MKKQVISVGFETWGNIWGNRIWLVRDLERKRNGHKDYYCVLGLTKGGWWHIMYGTLAECRAYIRREMAWHR